MKPTPEDLAAQYAQMSDTELMELAHSYDGLLEVAQAALRAEFARRGLEPPRAKEPEEWELRRIVTLRHYRDLTEAFVRRALRQPGDVAVADDDPPDGGRQPVSLLAQIVGLLLADGRVRGNHDAEKQHIPSLL